LAPRIAEIAKWQGGHITVKQLYGVGLSKRAIVSRTARGTLIRVHQGVYAVGHLPTNPLDKAHGALLAAGKRTALAGGTAAALWRADRTWPEPFELISARDVRLTGLTVHRSSTLIQRDIRKVQGLSVTSPARTALDIAPRLTMGELTRVVDDMRHVNRLTVAQLRDVANRNPRHPGARKLKQLIGDSQKEHTRSELERAFRRLIKRHKLEMPLINVHVGGERVDAYFPNHQLIIELDGGVTHGNDWRPAFENDRRRGVDILLKTGIPTVHFTWDQITRLHEETASKLDQILKARRAARTGPASAKPSPTPMVKVA
jgi:very-short-patch-repair endonuclease